MYHNYTVPTAPPGQPEIPSANTVDATLIRLHWNATSVVEFPISYYLVNAQSLNSSVRVEVTNTTTNITTFNVTGLLPGTTYELTVVAVSQRGHVIASSRPSDPVTVTTAVTGIDLPIQYIYSMNGDSLSSLIT